MGEHDVKHAQRLVVELVLTLDHVVEVRLRVVGLRELAQPDVDQRGQILIAGLQREDGLDGRQLYEERLQAILPAHAVERTQVFLQPGVVNALCLRHSQHGHTLTLQQGGTRTDVVRTVHGIHGALQSGQLLLVGDVERSGSGGDTGSATGILLGGGTQRADLRVQRLNLRVSGGDGGGVSTGLCAQAFQLLGGRGQTGGGVLKQTLKDG